MPFKAAVRLALTLHIVCSAQHACIFTDHAHARLCTKEQTSRIGILQEPIGQAQALSIQISSFTYSWQTPLDSVRGQKAVWYNHGLKHKHLWTDLCLRAASRSVFF